VPIYYDYDFPFKSLPSRNRYHAARAQAWQSTRYTVYILRLSIPRRIKVRLNDPSVPPTRRRAAIKEELDLLKHFYDESGRIAPTATIDSATDLRAQKRMGSDARRSSAIHSHCVQKIAVTVCDHNIVAGAEPNRCKPGP